jgi:PleD family two-component response regulator
MIRRLEAELHVVVVDSHPPDYHDLASLAAEYRWHLHFLTSARAAIMFIHRSRAALWIINSVLPDMSGFLLHDTLKDTIADASVLIVADSYSADDERRACQAGAMLYLCKSSSRVLECRQFLTSLMSTHPHELVDGLPNEQLMTPGFLSGHAF